MKKILSVLLVLLMVVALVPLSASATDPTTTDLGIDGTYVGIDTWQVIHIFPSESLTDIVVVIANNSLNISYKTNGVPYELNATFVEHPYESSYIFDSIEGDGNVGFHINTNEEFYFGGDVFNYLGTDRCVFEILLEKQEVSEPADYFTPFTGTATSNTAQYEVAIAGFIDMELLPGDNVLTLSDIQSNTIAVVAYNNNNGVKRTMNQTTIEEMTITVSDGQITQIYILGRVQTSPGTLDRYSTTITL